MTDLHKHYDRLTDEERAFLDDVMHGAMVEWRNRFPQDHKLPGDDRAEVAADALAAWVLSREGREIEVTADED